jgi:hypothetical protein
MFRVLWVDDDDDLCVSEQACVLFCCRIGCLVGCLVVRANGLHFAYASVHALLHTSKVYASGMIFPIKGSILSLTVK